MVRQNPHDSARLLLLDLIADAHDIAPNRIAGLDAAAWDDLARIGAYHRLEPLLHWQAERRHKELAIPPELRARWKAAFVASSRQQLGMQYEIRTLSRQLDAAGIPSILLKGSFLAFHAYPDPALRPLRDIDILVPEDRVLEAYRLMLSTGATPSVDEAQLDIVVGGGEHHLPPLVTARRFAVVELHRQIQSFSAAPRGRDPRLLADLWSARSLLPVAGVPIGYPSPTDMLLHLVLHAAQNHDLNNGPLTLPDIAFLLRGHAVDWPRFWGSAERLGVERAATLLLDLTVRYWGALPIEWAEGVRDSGLATISDLAAQIIVQDDGTALAIAREREVEKGSRAVARRIRREMAILSRLSLASPRDWSRYPARWGALAIRGARQLTARGPTTEIQRHVEVYDEVARWMAAGPPGHDG
jgi:hypothetical protein